jgi:queuine tRNA-ribosyltransferase
MFELIHQSTRSKARVGRIHTPHGVIETPNFVPVATNGALKSLDSFLVDQMNVELLFCNTYHLIVQPGAETVQQMGGLHRFMNRQKPIITDSGGFQVFSLKYGGVAQELKSKGKKLTSGGGVLKITEEGVLFRSYRDGSQIFLSPETSIEAQKKLGADIMISFDELPPYHMKPKALVASLDRTHRWEVRSLEAHKKNPNNQALYAVIHGGVDPVLRQKSAEFLREHDFDGYSIGGSVGKNQEEMVEMLTFLMPFLPQDKPNHLLGVADISSLEKAIPLGIDTFDSAYPTKCARHGAIFTKKEGVLKIQQTAYKLDPKPLEAGCQCHTCTHYSRAYLNHLFKSHELSAYTLATIHNVHHMVDRMKGYRLAILEGKI